MKVYCVAKPQKQMYTSRQRERVPLPPMKQLVQEPVRHSIYLARRDFHQMADDIFVWALQMYVKQLISSNNNKA